MAALFDPTLGEDPAQWQFRLIPLPTGHIAAVAARTETLEPLRIAVLDASRLYTPPFSAEQVP